ncbi:hypothetical protein [Marinicrinis sediminis]|uniref:Uncharacterized protein n=1 Tax=Marinicrinis sediminis TaxID=1652465 RepID=A0ABW5RAL6_9BACL
MIIVFDSNGNKLWATNSSSEVFQHIDYNEIIDWDSVDSVTQESRDSLIVYRATNEEAESILASSHYEAVITNGQVEQLVYYKNIVAVVENHMITASGTDTAKITVTCESDIDQLIHMVYDDQIIDTQSTVNGTVDFFVSVEELTYLHIYLRADDFRYGESLVIIQGV